jgi:hypothetical protein
MIARLLDFAPSLLLIAGGCALAVWAKGLKDEQSRLVSHLTGPPDGQPRARDTNARPDDRSFDFHEHAP